MTKHTTIVVIGSLWVKRQNLLHRPLQSVCRQSMITRLNRISLLRVTETTCELYCTGQTTWTLIYGDIFLPDILSTVKSVQKQQQQKKKKKKKKKKNTKKKKHIQYIYPCSCSVTGIFYISLPLCFKGNGYSSKGDNCQILFASLLIKGLLKEGNNSLLLIWGQIYSLKRKGSILKGKKISPFPFRADRFSEEDFRVQEVKPEVT